MVHVLFQQWVRNKTIIGLKLILDSISSSLFAIVRNKTIIGLKWDVRNERNIC